MSHSYHATVRGTDRLSLTHPTSLDLVSSLLFLARPHDRSSSSSLLPCTLDSPPRLSLSMGAKVTKTADRAQQVQPVTAQPTAHQPLRSSWVPHLTIRFPLPALLLGVQSLHATVVEVKSSATTVSSPIDIHRALPALAINDSASVSSPSDSEASSPYVPDGLDSRGQQFSTTDTYNHASSLLSTSSRAPRDTPVYEHSSRTFPSLPSPSLQADNHEPRMANIATAAAAALTTAAGGHIAGLSVPPVSLPQLGLSAINAALTLLATISCRPSIRRPTTRPHTKPSSSHPPTPPPPPPHPGRSTSRPPPRPLPLPSPLAASPRHPASSKAACPRPSQTTRTNA